MKRVLLALLLLAGAATPAARGEEVFAVVGGEVISAAEYDAALRSALRQRYYHRRVPDAELAEFQREVAGALIDRALLAAEAKRRGVGVEALQAAVRSVQAPTEAELRAYHASKAALFVEPERLRLSVILLRVDPASPRAQWEKARAESEAIRAVLEAGADFGALAEARSADPSAGRGGDMGYLHRGMIPEPVYAELEAMAPGALSQPTRLLEGYALFRLAERVPARAQEFDAARARAAQLWARDQSERRWQAFLVSLRAAGAIRIDLARYPALGGMAP